MAYRTIQSNFTGGLLSPLSTGLVGTDLYNKGLEMAENCFYGPSGGVYKRNGTKFGTLLYDPATQKTPDSKFFHAVIGEFDILFRFTSSKLYILRLETLDSTITMSLVQAIKQDFGDVSKLSITTNEKVLYVVSGDIAPMKIYSASGGLSYNDFVCEKIVFVTAKEGTAEEGSVKTTVATIISPTVQAFYDGRWFLGAQNGSRLTVWASRSYDAVNGVYRYNDFTTSYSVYSESTASWQAVDLADLAVFYTFDSNNATEIMWLWNHNGLAAGTDGGIYLCSQTSITSSTDNPLAFTKESNYGTAKNIVTSMGNYLLFASTDRKRVIALAYSQQYNSLTGGNISEVIEHYYTQSSQISEMAATDGPVPHLYVVVPGQDLFVCQFDPLNSIVAWSRICQSRYLPVSVCSISGVNRGSSAVAIATEHLTSDSLPVPDDIAILQLLEEVSAGSVWQYPTLDMYQRLEMGSTYNYDWTYNGNLTLLKRNYSYSNIETMQQQNNIPVAYDISNIKTISTAKPLTQPEETDPLKQQDWYVGETYSFAILIPRSELPANGTSQGTERAVKKVTLRLFNSYGGVVFLFPGFESGMIKSPNLGDVENNLTYDYGPTYRKPNNYAKQALYKIFDKDVFNGWQGLFTGDKAINFITPTVEDDRIAIVQSDPMPFAICAVIVDRAVKES